MGRMRKLNLAYDLFVQKALSAEPLTIDEICKATGWKASTVETYLRKQWEQFIVAQEGGAYTVAADFANYHLDTFVRINSQKYMVNKEPFKPIISRRTEELVTKSRESALLAVQIYNNPTLAFRTPGFIVHMIIAFNSLFHAMFEESQVDYYYRKDDGAPELVDGQPKPWSLSKCMDEYWGGDHNPVRKNLEFFIGLRNAIEHRFAPALDAAIAGECQALLFNYENMLVQEFSPHYSLATYLTVPLQLSRLSNKARIDALRELQKADYKLLREYVDTYRAALPVDILGSMDFSFRVFLIPQPANHESSADMSMEFIRADQLSKEELESIQQHAVTLIKTKTVPVVNHGMYKPKDVVGIIQSIEPRFRMFEHGLAWKYFNVRPRQKRADGCKTQYCQYDVAHNDFVYTPEWVELLKKTVKNEKKYQELISYKDPD